jgi:precorrin-6A/cobalt-precorrin-6A reductase
LGVVARKRVLVLGGTSEAMALAEVLAARSEIDAVLSLAGRTSAPRLPPIPHRIGGFGGVDGLVDYLRNETIDVLVDATHPFARHMTANAAEAAKRCGVPRIVFTRPPWVPAHEDHWTFVADTEAAVAALSEGPRRVFLTVGRLSLPAFRAAPQHFYLVRSIDAPDPDERPPNMALVLARGPFDTAAEQALMREYDIDILVTKNSGGTATDAKLQAARDLGLPVILIDRPPLPDGAVVYTVEDVLAFIASHAPPP